MPDTERHSAPRPDVEALFADLAAEHADLDGLLTAPDEASWGRPTRAEGWFVREQAGPLAFSEKVTAPAASDAVAIEREAAAAAGDPSYIARHVDRGRPAR